MQIDDELYEAFRPWMAMFDVVYFRTGTGTRMNTGIKFSIENLDTEPVLYARYDNKEIRLAMPSGELVSANNLAESKIKEASAWVQANSDYAIKRWKEDKLDFIEIEVP